MNVKFLVAALLLAGIAALTGCGGDEQHPADRNSALIEAAEEGSRDAEEAQSESVEAEAEVLSVLRPALHLRPYSGVENAFQLPDGQWCSISGVKAASSYAYGIPDDDLVSPDGETVVRINYFVDLDGTPGETIRAECLKATIQALGW